MQITYDPTATVFKGPQADEDFEIVVEQAPLSVGGSSGIQSNGDVVFTTQSFATVDNNFKVALSVGATLANESPSVCSVDGSGNVILTNPAGGMASVALVIPGLGSRRYTQQLARVPSAPTVYTGVQSIAAGSLLKYLIDQADALCAACTPGAAQQRYWVNADGSGGVNPANMLKRTDVVGWTPLNIDHISNSPRYLTPHHTTTAAHLAGVGSSSRFWTTPEGNNVYETTPSTIVCTRDPNGNITWQGPANKWLKVLDSDVLIEYKTATYSGALTKLLPANFRSYLPTCDPMVRIPAWVRRTNITTGADYWTQQLDMWRYGQFVAPVSPIRAGFAQPHSNGGGSVLWGGDSGSPAFLGINGEAILFTSISYGGAYVVGSNQHILSDMIPAINAAMQSMAQAAGDVSYASYAVQTADLSGFPAY